jgi:hypothetical protein
MIGVHLRVGALLGAVLLFPLGAAGAQATFTEVNVSTWPGTQAEVGIAVDPSNPKVMVAGAIDLRSFTTMPSFTSADGGLSWKRDVVLAPVGREIDGDPAIGVGPDGREYYAFLTDRGYNAKLGYAIAVRVHVATRPGPTAKWQTARLPASRTRAGADDKPAITVDLSTESPHYGRVYLAWVRWPGGESVRIAVNHSDDGGRSWSIPVEVSARSARYAFFPSVAVSATGDVYVAWIANLNEIRLAHSVDGGATFGTERLVDKAIVVPNGPCPRGSGLTIPAQPRRCVEPSPTVAVDRSDGPYAGRVYLTYGAAGASGREQNVYVAAFDPGLVRLLGGNDQRVQVNPADTGGPSDQFLPASIVDPDTGRVWTCFYDTAGTSRRTKTYFSCASSADGGTTWTLPVRAASIASDMTQRGASRFEYGDYEGIAAAGGVAHPIWTDSRDLETRGAEIYTTSIAESDLPQS